MLSSTEVIQTFGYRGKEHLLEVAYKSAYFGAELYKDPDMARLWNPIVKDSDAFNLAICCSTGFEVDDLSRTIWSNGVSVKYYLMPGKEIDIYVATRLAITIGAAELYTKGERIVKY
jgi:hypothetical protein